MRAGSPRPARGGDAGVMKPLAPGAPLGVRRGGGASSCINVIARHRLVFMGRSLELVAPGPWGGGEEPEPPWRRGGAVGAASRRGQRTGQGLFAFCTAQPGPPPLHPEPKSSTPHPGSTAEPWWCPADTPSPALLELCPPRTRPSRGTFTCLFLFRPQQVQPLPGRCIHSLETPPQGLPPQQLPAPPRTPCTGNSPGGLLPAQVGALMLAGPGLAGQAAPRARPPVVVPPPPAVPYPMYTLYFSQHSIYTLLTPRARALDKHPPPSTVPHLPAPRTIQPTCSPRMSQEPHGTPPPQSPLMLFAPLPPHRLTMPESE